MLVKTTHDLFSEAAARHSEIAVSVADKGVGQDRTVRPSVGEGIRLVGQASANALPLAALLQIQSAVEIIPVVDRLCETAAVGRDDDVALRKKCVTTVAGLGPSETGRAVTAIAVISSVGP